MDISATVRETRQSIGISDMRGIRDRIAASQDGEIIQLTPGNETSSLFCSGVKADISLDAAKQTRHFSFLLKLNGSQQIIPTGTGPSKVFKMV